MSKLRFLSILFLFVIILAGCGYSRPCWVEDLSGYDDYDIALDDPVNGSVVDSLRPTLDWHSLESCRPHRYLITVQMKEKNGVWTYLVDGDSTNYHLEYSLPAGGEYYWTVRSYTGSGSDDYRGKLSPEWRFYTGPVCEGTPRVAPEPVLDFRSYDRYGEWISPNDAYKFEWYYPGDCLPESYYYEFAEDWNFTSILASGVTSDYRQFVELELPDCISGYWRVAAGTRTSHGPFSEKRRFFWASDEGCWMMHVLSPELTRIHGRVYEDYCPNTTFLTSARSIPDGCVSTRGIGVHADGLDRPWEPGIENVQVDLRSGYCPTPDEMAVAVFPDSPDRETAVTDSSGVFEFVVLNPGIYCLSVYKDQPEVPMLTSGLWTEPLTESDYAYKTIEIPAYTPKIFEDIGWDQYDYPLVHMEHTTHCREGDSKAFPAAGMIENQFVPLIARNPDGTWFKTILDGVECFFYYLPEGDEGEPSEDEIMELPVFESPPLPLPSPTPTSKPKPSKPSVNCSNYSTKSSCEAAGCTWSPNQVCIK
jgi:hypothetical protein